MLHAHRDGRALQGYHFFSLYVACRGCCSGEPSGFRPLESDSVFFLPGTIDIRRVRQLEELSRAPGGRAMFARFMVRGHWRRPAKNWMDRRLRWIEPYWKGPDMAAIIERTFKLKP